MAKFPTHEEMAKNIAEKALDEFLYDGKSIREWMQIIASEDCVSRQAVRKILVEAKELGSWDDSSQINRLDAIDNVDMLPSVTPQEPKIGHWILTDDNFVYCSECEDSYYPRPIDASWYYCPHCGAKMIEPQKSEDKE